MSRLLDLKPLVQGAVANSLVASTLDRTLLPVLRLGAARLTSSLVAARAGPIAHERLWAARRPSGRDHLAELVSAIGSLDDGTEQPIVVGPWLSEVGYEILYWIPLLQWAVRTYPRLRPRLIAISRGGTEAWYGRITARYVDVFSLMDVERFRKRREEVAAVTPSGRLLQRQETLTELDREVLDEAARCLEIARYRLLHPTQLYAAIRQLNHLNSVPRLSFFADYQPYRRQPVGDLEGRLPAEYVAVRFYANHWFPASRENRELIEDVLEALTRRVPVVLLNPALTVDDHSDFEPRDGDGLIRVHDRMTPETNLGVQTAVISRARAFVGTHGGLSYIGPFFGVPAVAFYSEPAEFPFHHVHLVERATSGPGFAPLLVSRRDRWSATRDLVGLLGRDGP